MKVAVTGATGFIGSHLVQRLVASGHDVVAAIHSRSRAPRGVIPRECSVEDPASLGGAFEGCRVVCHLVGIITETRTNTFDGTVAKGTANVVEACQSQGVERIVYLSAMGTGPDAQTHYHKSKYRAEQAVSGSGLDFVILRPSVVYGEGDGFVSLLARMIRLSPVTPIVGSGRYLLQPVYVDDLVGIMDQSLTSDAARNRIIDVGGPEKLEYLEILAILKQVMGKRRMNLHVPVSIVRVIAALLEQVLKPAPVTRDQLRMMEMGNAGDITAMKQIFDAQPVSFARGLSMYMRQTDG